MADEPGEATRRRRSPRIVGPFKANWCGAMKVPLVVHDLSSGGCLILGSRTTLPVGRMTLEICLPGGEWITVDAEPLHVRRNMGFVVRFVDVPPTIQNRLQRAIASVAGPP